MNQQHIHMYIYIYIHTKLLYRIQTKAAPGRQMRRSAALRRPSTPRSPKTSGGGLRLRLGTTETSHRLLVATAFACISPFEDLRRRDGKGGG